MLKRRRLLKTYTTGILLIKHCDLEKDSPRSFLLDSISLDPSVPLSLYGNSSALFYFHVDVSGRTTLVCTLSALLIPSAALIAHIPLKVINTPRSHLRIRVDLITTLR